MQQSRPLVMRVLYAAMRPSQLDPCSVFVFVGPVDRSDRSTPIFGLLAAPVASLQPEASLL